MSSYKDAITQLDKIKSGKCVKNCRAVWMRKLKSTIKSKKNPLNLTATQYVRMTAKINDIYGRNHNNSHSKTLKKYKTRPSPPYPAGKYCNLEMKGNDGNRYKSLPNSNNVYTWRKIKT